ncbi:MAG: hypothetical protein A3C06_01080 [Candidatus Taylorbacteria bacterium RIFCSPHIGHO2_02_FULL_46_13]|uniref:PsbP C-terminal domain-containing protein n=1 Tax=Candidatus Taylorbacteria bacterium RIFCSPHIGHO2_02_FULL_46_13 TaxID=1802312 RepID=A0A1G2MTA7_9BACT|nr:MAG: hypothetical protein A3C06_01080 [Candidatus Taylorbacteria bacterium RIFCSPHIGHO2_02_FULL_46_13]
MTDSSHTQKIIFAIIIVLVVLVVGIIIFWRSPETLYTKENGQPANPAGTIDISPSALATYSSGRFGFSFAYPETLVVGKSEENTIGWRSDAVTSTGTIATKIVIPKSFQPQTNFGEATFLVGFSAEPDAITDCFKEDFTDVEVASMNVGGIPFRRFHYIDAAAGNRYDITSYRTVYSDRCYAVETVIHYANIENYSPDQNISEFNQAQVQKVLDTMVTSFRFR